MRRVGRLGFAAAAGMLVALIGCQPVAPSVSETPSPVSETPSPPSSASTLPDLPMPGGRASRAGDYGWTGGPGSRGGMHNVVDEGGGAFRQTQFIFAVADDCFAGGEGPDPVPVTIGGFDSLYVEPYRTDDPWSVMFVPSGGETTGAYALAIGDRTLCVYLSWDPTTTPAELDAARAVVESIRAQPIFENSIRIVFTTQFGWDIG